MRNLVKKVLKRCVRTESCRSFEVEPSNRLLDAIMVLIRNITGTFLTPKA